jgi:dihydroxyacetone kinase-like protein
MIRGAAESIRNAQDLLSQLDSATGDGDHGITMVRAMDRLESVVAGGKAGNLRELLEEAAWALFGIDGGATGPLLGSFFQGLADASAHVWDVHGLAAAFESGLCQLQKQSRAQIGDKTMMDALIPAVQALRQAANEAGGIAEAMHRAAEAALAGAASTANLTARFGRAKYLGEQTIGHRDPGATSIALILQGFYDVLRQEAEAVTAFDQTARMRQ